MEDFSEILGRGVTVKLKIPGFYMRPYESFLPFPSPSYIPLQYRSRSRMNMSARDPAAALLSPFSPPEPGRVTCDLRFINHSNEPNAAYYDDLSVMSLRDIRPGEEIVHNYMGDAVGEGDAMDFDVEPDKTETREPAMA